MNLLNTFRENLEDKLKKVLVITDEISILTEDDKNMKSKVKPPWTLS